jgi:hypothetical protein
MEFKNAFGRLPTSNEGFDSKSGIGSVNLTHMNLLENLQRQTDKQVVEQAIKVVVAVDPENNTIKAAAEKVRSWIAGAREEVAEGTKATGGGEQPRTGASPGTSP